MKPLLSLILLLLLIGTKSYSQGADSNSYRKNTIKLELTPLLLYRNALVFSYERITKPNQSLILTAGVQEFPSIGRIGDSIVTKTERKRSGNKFGAEYRFYLKKENKYQGPHGVYIGPYTSILSFKNEKDITVNKNGIKENALLKTQLNVLNIGFELGYQFVFNDRWTLDMVFVGPSYSNYKAKMSLDGNFTFDENDIENEYLQQLIEKFPGLKNIFDGEKLSKSGKANKWGLGYRYQFHVGYRFGGKKK